MNYINKIFEKKSHIYAKFINQYKFKYQFSFMVILNKFEADGDIRKEAEMSLNLNMINNLIQFEIDIVNVQWDLESRIQNLEMKESG